MDLYSELNRLLQLINGNIILCLLPAISLFFVLEKFAASKFQTKSALNLSAKIIVFLTILNWVFFLSEQYLSNESIQFVSRSQGPYKVVYLFLFCLTMLVPFSLLWKTFYREYWAVLLILFLMNLGQLIEKLVVITTSFHRDYLPSEFFAELTWVIGLILIQGVVLGALLLVIAHFWEKRNTINI